ncbi:MAG: SPW repeat protein [Armatimonadota bacterium]|nr:SPW repeat protein [Armatimonadota bacterium]MDR7440430.1 SPW repeat protein [Armatimonadota bacterium]MDR7443968.1 SPW repeat protein [Armatimonadota bacterium]MDR7570066.1 SPW repeat protein [Armatimonadota bacterium]MDR7615429.1 SPW repeat protein [Armatimonadota bacterium]
MKGWAWVNLVLGAWLVVAPWILGYGGGPALTNDVVLGLAVVVVSLILLASPAQAEAPVSARQAPGQEMMSAAAMRDMAAGLARMPDAQRKVMLGERLRMFAEMGEAERKRAMAAMMDAVAALPDEDKKKLFKTRFEVLAELSETDRKKLMGTHMSILMERGEEMMRKEMELTEAVLPQLPAHVRQMVQGMMSGMMGGRH